MLPPERELREGILEISPTPITIVNDEGRVVLANEQAKQELGLEEDRLLGLSADDSGVQVFDPDGEPVDAESTVSRRVLRTGEPVRGEEIYVSLPNDRALWLSVSGSPLTEDGEVQGVVVVFEEITERKEHQRRFEAIFNQTYQFTGLMEPDGTLIEANDTALAFGGVDREDVLGKKVWNTYWFQVDEETPERVREDVQRAREGEFVRYELEVQGAEGTAVIDFSLKPITDERGEVTLIVPEGRDITELKEREEALHEERAFTESILAGLPDALYAFDEHGNFLRWNDQFAEATGYTDAEIAEMEPLDFIPDDEATKIAENIAAVIESGETVTVESYFETKDGERVPYEFTGAPLVDEHGTELGLVGIGRDVTERRERERQFDAVFNNTFQFTGLMEPDGTLIRANDTALEFAGVDPEDVLGTHLAETAWITDDNRDRIYEATDRAADGEFVRFEMEINGAEGPATIDFSLKPVTDEDDAVVLLIPEGRDITERKAREEALREEQAFTDSMLGAVPDIFYAYDAEGNFVRWNERFADVTGYDDTEIAEMEPLDFIPDDESDVVGEAIESILADGEPVVIESALETKAGERIPYEYKAGQWRGPDGEVLGVVGIGRDVTERRERERRFEAIFNQTYQFTGLMEPDGTLIEANDTALEFVGVDREEVVGEHLAEAAWITPEYRDRVYEATERARQGEFVRFEMEINGAEPGETVPIDFSLKPVTDEQGEVVLLIPEGRDIRELKERERELAEKTEELERTVDQLERTNAELEQFAYVASHDLQEPLRMISSYLDLLELEYDEALDEEAHEYIEYAVDGADRMREMIDDLLAFSRIQTREEEFERQPLESVLEEALDNLALAVAESDATITHDDLPTLPVDDHQLRQLFQNLLDNAISYAGDDPPRVHIDGTEHDDHWEFTVADEGVGIPEEEQDRIFDIFMRGAGTEEGGSGIGLAICKRVVENHGGRIEVDSARGEGTTVRFTLDKRPGPSGGGPA